MTINSMNKNNNEELPYSLITLLYKDVLIDDKTYLEKNAVEDVTVPKDVLIIAKSVSTNLNEKQILFLTSILKALKLGLNDVHLITNLNDHFGPYKTLVSKYSPNKIILFGLGPSDIELPMNFPPFQIQAFENKKYLCAPTLEEIEENKSTKLTLWQGLQKLFL
jgi:DNA polymerase III psi subunit